MKPIFKYRIYSIIVLIISIILVSYPGWFGKFIFDDYSNIKQNNTLIITEFNTSKFWTAALSGASSGIGRPLSMLSFAIDSYFHGLNPYYFKITNTTIHIINALLVFWLSIKLLSLSKFRMVLAISDKAALFVTFLISFIWAISPININSSLYIVQRMNELSFLFVLSGCILYLYIRTSSQFNRLYQLFLFLGFSLLLLLATLSKENGVLLIPMVLLLDFFVLDKNKNNKLFFYCIFILLFLFPTIWVSNFIINHFDRVFNYNNFDFSLLERALTQLRVTLFYIKQLLFPDIDKLSYFNDDYIISSSLINPFSTLLSLLFWVGTVACSLFYKKRYPWILYGLLWFLIGHSIESTIIPLELIFEHRNYLPSYGIIFMLVISVYFLYTKIQSQNIKRLLISSSIFYVLFLLFYAYSSAKIIGSPLLLFKTYAENHPDSARSQLSWGEINYQFYLKNPNNIIYSKNAEYQFKKVLTLNPDRIAALTNLIILKKINHENYDQELVKLYKNLSKIKNSAQHVEDTRRFIVRNSSLSKPLSRSIITKYFNIILNNKKFLNTNKSLLHKEYADYIYHSNNNTTNKEALKHYMLFAKLNPTIEIKIYLATILLNAKKYEKASLLLQEIDMSNTKKLYLFEINNLKSALKARQNH
jgi:protein O-mannosyl-transferase